jgi:predicted dehydrogenase
MIQHVQRVWRYARIYGVSRTLSKIQSRLGVGFALSRGAQEERDVTIIGCGQFAYSTIAYFLHRRRPHCIGCVYDPEPARTAAMRDQYSARPCSSAAAALDDAHARYLYIASNHHSHADYAIAGLERGLDVYVEKPVSVTWEQLSRLSAARRGARGRLFAGYNRPHSAALLTLRQAFDRHAIEPPITLMCHVSGHAIGPDHWYRRPEEGTRICGNMGHWIDLAIHILSWRKVPESLDISISYANPDAPDDNLAVDLTSPDGDLVSIVLTARSEPFEGIRETIMLNAGRLIARIDDFRKLELDIGASRQVEHYRPKDVGHERSVMQPFGANCRWEEVEASTMLMLCITDMVRSKTRSACFSFAEARSRLERIAQAEGY